MTTTTTTTTYCHSCANKRGHIRDERSGVKNYPYTVKKGQSYIGWAKKVIPLVQCNVMYERYHVFGTLCINLNPGRLFVQQPPKRERDQEAHLNYYASAYNSGRQLSHRKTELNQIQQKQARIFN